jgi:predicted nucleic acid-binding protein
VPVAFDATILLLLFSPGVPAPLDPATGQPVEFVDERIAFLLKQLEKSRTKIIVPTPALSEILVHADRAGPDYLNRMKQSSAFEIKPFDDRAAVEVALMTREAIKSGDKRSGTKETWAKVKFDRQIVAIAKVNGVSIIYSDDEDVQHFAKRADMMAIAIPQLPLPPVAPAQTNYYSQNRLRLRHRSLPCLRRKLLLPNRPIRYCLRQKTLRKKNANVPFWGMFILLRGSGRTQQEQGGDYLSEDSQLTNRLLRKIAPRSGAAS